MGSYLTSACSMMGVLVGVVETGVDLAEMGEVDLDLDLDFVLGV